MVEYVFCFNSLKQNNTINARLYHWCCWQTIVEPASHKQRTTKWYIASSDHSTSNVFLNFMCFLGSGSVCVWYCYGKLQQQQQQQQAHYHPFGFLNICERVLLCLWLLLLSLHLRIIFVIITVFRKLLLLFSSYFNFFTIVVFVWKIGKHENFCLVFLYYYHRLFSFLVG